MQNSSIKVGMVSLGCPKNQCDAEIMLAKIVKAGFKLVSEAGLADVVIINTCGFIQSAKEEAIEEIFEAVNRKNDGINKKIIVTGCLAERYREQLEEEFPEIDGIVGISKNDDIVKIIGNVMDGQRVTQFAPKDQHNMEGEKMLGTLPHYAYVRIADGCDNCCSYCAIPSIRGRFRSRKMENVLDEVKKLAESGVKEIVLVAQDTTRYGFDIYGKLMLPQLLEEMCKIDGVKWIRLLYCYPERITRELIDTIKTQEKIVKYIDVPIQHCNKEILVDMNRQGDEQELWDLFATLRSEIPGIVLRTTVITGFPGETEEQFVELAEFVNNVKFEHLGCFAYSEEEGTYAAQMDYQVDEAERVHRSEVIVEQQEVRVCEFYESLIGREYDVVIEGYDKYFEMYFGRNYMMAPEIDGMIYFTGKNLTLSDFTKVKITSVVDNNLIGETV